MSADSGELVLCCKAADLPLAWLPESGAIPLDESTLLGVLAGVSAIWLPRRQAESDSAFKQWIPYVLLRNPRGEFAAYPRNGGEARLHGQWSLGIGGHVNPIDLQCGGSPDAAWRDLLWNGLRRELAEEVPSAIDGETRFLGLVHECLSPVGQVHLGAVFLHRPTRFDSDSVGDLKGLEWLPTTDLARGGPSGEKLELWSKLALQLVASSRR